jgi:hypothetical protein
MRLFLGILSFCISSITFAQATSDIAIQAGQCQIYSSPQLANVIRYSWRGGCVDGFAEGAGLLESIHTQSGQVAILQQTRHAGRPGEFVRYHYDGSTYYRIDGDGKSPPKGRVISRSELPTWAAHLSQLYEDTRRARNAVAAAPPAPVASNAAELKRENEEREREEVLAAIERRTRESEEIDRQMARERRELREARGRELTDAMQSALQGAAALRQQQASESARLQAERQRIERDNERYRQQQTEQNRQWQLENQRRQQDLLARERASEQYERQRREQVAQTQANRCAALPSPNHIPWPQAQSNGAAKCSCEGGQWRAVAHESFSCFKNGEAKWGCGSDQTQGSQCGQK